MTSETLAKQSEYFSRLAKFGTTKHGGGLVSSLEMLALAQVKQGDYVLDVGCGMGLTPIYITKNIGARVMGVDINPHMVERSKERANKMKLSHLAEFQEADAMRLPFEDDSFNVVITESVTAFPADKARAIREYVRVTKPGGFIGLNESTWLKTPIPEEIQAWVSQDLGANASPLQPAEWIQLMAMAQSRLRAPDLLTARRMASPTEVGSTTAFSLTEFGGVASAA